MSRHNSQGWRLWWNGSRNEGGIQGVGIYTLLRLQVGASIMLAPTLHCLGASINPSCGVLKRQPSLFLPDDH